MKYPSNSSHIGILFRKLMTGYIVPSTVFVRSTNKIYNFLRENWYDYQGGKRKNLTSSASYWLKCIGYTSSSTIPLINQTPWKDIIREPWEFSFNKLCLNKCSGVFIQCLRRLEEAYGWLITEPGALSHNLDPTRWPGRGPQAERESGTTLVDWRRLPPCNIVWKRKVSISCLLHWWSPSIHHIF